MPPSRVHKTIGISFGSALVILGIVIVVVADAPARVGSFIAALVLVGLGLDQVISSLRGRTSILERIGPLP